MNNMIEDSITAFFMTTRTSMMHFVSKQESYFQEKKRHIMVATTIITMQTILVEESPFFNIQIFRNVNHPNYSLYSGLIKSDSFSLYILLC